MIQSGHRTARAYRACAGARAARQLSRYLLTLLGSYFRLTLDNVKLYVVKLKHRLFIYLGLFVKTYKTVSDLADALQSGEIPTDVVSPGGAAQMLGVTRQAINDRLHHGNSLEAWGAEGYILISVESIKLALEKKRTSGNQGS